jgi:hypothetical protein
LFSVKLKLNKPISGQVSHIHRYDLYALLDWKLVMFNSIFTKKVN